MLEVFVHAMPWATVTPISIVVAFSSLVWSGRLIPRSWEDKRAADQAAQITYLQTTLAHQEATIASLTKQNHELAVTGELSVALLRSLQQITTVGPAPALTNHSIRPLDPGAGSAHVAAIDEG